MRMSRFVQLCLMLLGTLIVNGRARAVEVDSNGSGQVLILPLWTTTGGHATLLNVQAARPGHLLFVYGGDGQRQIAKLRLLDGEGNVVLSGNLYFTGNGDSWTAGIGAREGGGSRLVSSDSTCLLVDGNDGVEPLSGSMDIDANFGSLEMIVMGNGWQVDHGVAANGPEAVCANLALRWNEGDWSETSEAGVSMNGAFQLRAEWQIVNVERGTLFHVPGVALDDYSDRVQHTPPGDPLPNLASGHGPQTDEGVTSSRTCSDGLCREDTWQTPLDAMAAALMVKEINGSFNINPETGSTTDLVLTSPLQKYFAERDGLEHPLASNSAGIRVRSRDGWTYPLCDFGSCPPPPACEFLVEATQASTLLPITFNPFPVGSEFVESPLLGLPGTTAINRGDTYIPSFLYGTLPPEGIFGVSPACSPASGTSSTALTSLEGYEYFGLPVIPVVFQQSINGVLTAGDGTPQRANYGTAIAPSTWVWSLGAGGEQGN